MTAATISPVEPAPIAPPSVAPTPVPANAPAQPPAPTTTSTPSPPALAECVPVMRPTSWIDQRGLSDDGFCDSLAHLPLSRTTAVTLSIDEMTLSHRALAEFNIAMRRAWDVAADNVLRAAHTPQGTEFWTRPAADLLGPSAPPGIQLRSYPVPATCWLAHPRLLSVMHDHLARLLGTDALIFLAPDITTLVAVTECTIPAATGWLRVAAENTQAVSRIVGRPELLCESPLVAAHGFPTELC